MKPLFIIKPSKISNGLEEILRKVSRNYNVSILDEYSKLPSLQNVKLLFLIELDDSGFCIPVFNILSKLKERGFTALLGSTGGVIIISPNELFTKTISRRIIFLANQIGCSFIGHSVVEAITDFKNFNTWKKNLNLPLNEIFDEQCSKLAERLINDKSTLKANPKITLIHSSSNKTSNTLMLWNIVKKNLNTLDIMEFKIENGAILDCKGCSFKSCLHYSQQRGCFYGGIMTEEIYPALEKSDALVMICPNYNDALSANLTAFINRLTALYRRVSFYNKTLFAIIVSGNSGSDSVAVQLIDALNINKGFRLPQYFALMEIANDPGAVKQIPDIYNVAKWYANNIIRNIYYSEDI